MERSVAVVAYPYLYSSVIADAVRRRDGYRVDAPDVLSVWEPTAPYDIVIASLPVPTEWGRVIIRLPDDFTRPLEVSIDDVTVEVDVDERNPLDGLLQVLDRLATPRPSAPPGRPRIVDLT